MKSEQSTVTTKGQLVIPARLRKKYSIRKGTKVAFIEDDNRLILQPITNEFIQRIRGSLKGKPSTPEFLLKTRREESERRAASFWSPGRSSRFTTIARGQQN